MTCNIMKWLYQHRAICLFMLFLMVCLDSFRQDNSQSFNQKSVTSGFRLLL